MTEPEKLDLRSHDIAGDKREELLRLFPEIRTEGGKLDFERLKLVLGEAVDVGKERYGLTWPGKAECLKVIQTPSMGTLLPCREESVNFDTTENLIIEGDNLEVLKLLQKSYLGKVKLIYIDPPYNTGNDFIYPDNYSESLQTYLEYTGQVDDEGKRFGSNTEADGRFHSKWLSMMYPRLFLARNLLREDGVIFVSIDDHEADNLRKVMNDIFGEESFVAQIVVVNNLKGRNDREHIATAHEYLMMYAMRDFESLGLPLTEKQLADYREQSDGGDRFQWRDLRRRGGGDTREARPNLYFPVFAEPASGECSLERTSRHNVEILPRKRDGTDGRWRWGAQRVRDNLTRLQASRTPNGEKWNISYRVFLETEGKERVAKPKSVWLGPELSTDAATRALKSILPGELQLTPKPVDLLKAIVVQSLDEGDIAFDFFAGSGTTAQAVLEASRHDGIERHFILSQLPEPTRTRRPDESWDETAAWKAGYHTIADITKQRVRRVIEKLNAEDSGKLHLDAAEKQDRGFRAFKLANSNFRPWNAEVPHEPGAVVTQLEAFVDHVRDTRGPEDLLYELLLKSGFPLTAPVETLTFDQKSVYAIAGGAMLVCLERELTLDLIRAIADRKPQRIVCLDEGFAKNDQLKANAVQLFKTKGVAKFQTV